MSWDTDKAHARRQARERRDSMSEADRHRRWSVIGEHLWQHPAMAAAKCVMFYMAFGSEVDVAEVIVRALKHGRAVALPFVEQTTRTMVPKSITALDDTVVGPYGIRQPKPSASTVRAHHIDVVIVPALAFDEDGYRLGYGGGYYDRFLPQLHPATALIGVQYDELVVPRLVREAHDVPVNCVVTDRRVIEVGQS